MPWTPIFRTGTHTDSQGRSRTWTTTDLDKAVSSYDPATREAPLVLGHPKDNGPAFGWIEKLRRTGEVLEACFKQVPEELRKAVEAGRYKHKSVSFYKDGSVRHVGLLGAAQPAVEGLGAITFSDEEDCFEYNQQQEDAGVTIEELQRKLDAEKAAREAAEIKADGFKEKAETAETRVREVETANKKLSDDFAQAEATKAREAREARFDKLAGDAKVLPAEKDKILAFAEHLGAESEEISFAESEGKKPLEDHFWSFLESRKEHGLFKEFTAPEGTGDDAYVDLSDKV
jgi:DNA-binding transcriptional MerR regulator